MNYKLWKLIRSETNNNSYYLSPSSIKHEKIFRLKNDVLLLCKAVRLPWNKRRNIVVHEGKKKSKIKMMFESVSWFLKYNELCDFYFAYGLDINGGGNSDEYLGYSEFRMIRNIVNIRLRENLQTNYTFNYLALTRDKFGSIGQIAGYSISQPLVNTGDSDDSKLSATKSMLKSLL